MRLRNPFKKNARPLRILCFCIRSRDKSPRAAGKITRALGAKEVSFNPGNAPNTLIDLGSGKKVKLSVRGLNPSALPADKKSGRRLKAKELRDADIIVARPEALSPETINHMGRDDLKGHIKGISKRRLFTTEEIEMMSEEEINHTIMNSF